MLLFYILISTFKIQDRATLKFIGVLPDSKIKMVDEPEEAAKYDSVLVERNSIDVFLVNQVTKLNLGLGHDKIFLQEETPVNQVSQIFQINLDKDGFYQISQGDDLFLTYDSFTNGLVAHKFKKNTHTGFLLFTDEDNLPYPLGINRGRESPYRKRPIPIFDVQQHKLEPYEGALGNQVADEWAVQKSFENEKHKRHDISVDSRDWSADKHAQAHNASAKDFRDHSKFAGMFHKRGQGGETDTFKSDNLYNEKERFRNRSYDETDVPITNEEAIPGSKPSVDSMGSFSFGGANSGVAR